MDANHPCRAKVVGEKRLLQVTAGNLRQSTLPLRGHLDFFPADAVGPPRKSANGHGIDVILDGLGETIHTDIPRDATTGRPRHFLRDRRSTARFYKHHGITGGSYVSLERLAERTYRLSLAPSGSQPPAAQSGSQAPAWEPPNPRLLPRSKPRAAEFFAGIGLVRLALERQGWEVVFANDIDEEKAQMYRDNWPGDNHLVVGDIHDLKPNDIPDCELWTASFPCNDLSIAGRWEGLSGKESSANSRKALLSQTFFGQL